MKKPAKQNSPPKYMKSGDLRDLK